MYAMYNNLPYPQNEFYKPAENHFPKSLAAKTEERIIDDETDFFNRIYSAYYKIALKAVKAINSKEISTQEELLSYISSFKILKGKTQIKSKKYKEDFLESTADLFMIKNGKLYTPFMNISNDFMFPLTTIEISFLKALVNDDRCKLIMGDSFNLLKSELDTPKYNDIYPYFDRDKYIVFDQYLNGDQLLFEDQTYKENLKLLIDAVKGQRAVFFEYIEDGMPKTKVSVPEKIEYSQKENRFKVVLNSKNRPLDIQNIRLCKYSDGKLSPSKKKEILTCVVAIDVPEDKKYTRNRLFREFSPFERDCEKVDELGHILKFKFEAGDYKEIAYRLLQFGPYVYCSEPECVRERIKEKIDQQYALLNQGAKFN